MNDIEILIIYFSRIHFINLNVVINIDCSLSHHNSIELNFLCDSFQSVFSTSNGSVITLSDGNPRSVPESREIEEDYGPKAPLGTEA